MTLQCGCEAILTYPGVLLIELLAVMGQLCWVFISIMACVGLYVYLQHEGQGTSEAGRQFFGVLLIYFWGQQIMEGVIVCTIASVTGDW